MIRIRLPLQSALPLFYEWPEGHAPEGPFRPEEQRGDAAPGQGDRRVQPSGQA